MPRQPTSSLGEALEELVGTARYQDNLLNSGHTRMKWDYEFNIDLAYKVKLLLEEYEMYVIEYNPSYRQNKGSLRPFAVIKFLVNPYIIPLNNYKKRTI